MRKADDLRTLFVRTTMGDFLRCFRCDSCGAQFMVNKEPNKHFLNYYGCPVCHMSEVRANDLFLKAMVSGKQLENTRWAQQVQKENDSLRPFKIFFDVPCCICGQSVTEWTEQNLRKGIRGVGWGHVVCWKTPMGQGKQLAKLIKDGI